MYFLSCLTPSPWQPLGQLHPLPLPRCGPPDLPLPGPLLLWLLSQPAWADHRSETPEQAGPLLKCCCLLRAAWAPYWQMLTPQSPGPSASSLQPCLPAVAAGASGNNPVCCRWGSLNHHACLPESSLGCLPSAAQLHSGFSDRCRERQGSVHLSTRANRRRYFRSSALYHGWDADEGDAAPVLSASSLVGSSESHPASSFPPPSPLV